jgi:hypothetical protein
MTVTPVAVAGRTQVACGTAAVAVFTWWTLHEGGAAPATWYPAAVVPLVALVAALWARGSAWPGRPAVCATAALAAFTLWSFLSLVWAEARGDAWDGANRTLLYLTVFALFALLPWRPAEAGGFLAAFAGATAVVGLGSVAAAAFGGDPGAFDGGRLAAPIGYENASAALFLAAFWPAVMLAALPRLSPAARAALLAASGVLLQLVILCQSRGSLLAAGAGLVLALALTRDRPRLLLALVVVGAGAVPTLPFLLDVFAAGGSDGEGALRRALVAIVASAMVLAVAGLLAPRIHVTRRPRRGVALVLVAALIVAGLGAAVAGAVGTRFAGGAGSGRYDFWRVAWTQLARDPVLGAGADNFAHAYARERRGHEEPLYPHSIEWRTLGGTGMVGAALLAGFFAAVCAGMRRSTADPVTVAALVSAAAWLAHATIDWQWELPALGAPAMACLGIVAARPGQPRAGPLVARRLRIAATVVAAAAAASYALPGLAAREIERGVAGWDRDPGAARERLERARTLNPLSDRADVIAGTLALEDGDVARSGRAFRRAAGRDAGNWYAQAQLGIVALRQGRREAAIAALARAQRMNPNEDEIAVALDAARASRALPPGIEAGVAREAVPGPMARHPVDCRPVLGLGRDCGGP